MDEIKSNANEASGNGGARAAVKSAKKPLAKKSAAGAEKNSKKSSSEHRSAGPRGVMPTLISVFITAAIVGGAIYVWQKNSAQKKVEEVKSETEVVKMDFEKRINNLKSTLTGTETANIDLQKTLADLQKKAELLIGAKREASDEALGLSFEYPAGFGLVVMASSTAASSTDIRATFENNDKFVYTAVSNEYERTGTSTVKLSELKGFVEKGKKFYLLGPDEKQEFEINPAKTIETGLGKAVLIDKNSFTVADGNEAPVEIGGDVAVVLNLKNEKYPAVIFVDSDFGLLPLEDLIKLIESIK